MEPVIPDGIDSIDDDWLSQAMGTSVRIANIEDIGTGVGMIGAIYRATLEGDCPDTVVIKLPGLDETARFTAQILRLNIREVGFYRELAAESPIRVPHCHFGAVDPDTHQFVLVLEDVGSYRAVSQIEGMGRADAEQAVDELAAWHAHWWGRAGPIVERGTAMAIHDPIYPMLLPPVFSDGWAKVRAAMSVPRSVETVADGWVEALPEMLGSLATTPSTLVHGDYRADNMFFDDDGRVVLLDFQVIGQSMPVGDLAYFVTGSLSPATASEIEQGLYARWLQALVSEGVPESETDGMWDIYRGAILFCVCYPMIAGAGMDLTDERQRGLLAATFERFERAADELSLPDLL
jgi:hypothetical protein